MKRYYVIATIWSEEDKAQIKTIAGEFTAYSNAILFKEAYNEKYSADAYITDEWSLLNR